MTEGTQRYRVVLEMTYEDVVFDDDPADLYDLAALQKQLIERNLEYNFDPIEYQLTVEPA